MRTWHKIFCAVNLRNRAILFWSTSLLNCFFTKTDFSKSFPEPQRRHGWGTIPYPLLAKKTDENEIFFVEKAWVHGCAKYNDTRRIKCTYTPFMDFGCPVFPFVKAQFCSCFAAAANFSFQGTIKIFLLRTVRPRSQATSLKWVNPGGGPRQKLGLEKTGPVQKSRIRNQNI